MFIDVTRTIGNKIRVNVLEIYNVSEERKDNSLFSLSMEGTNIRAKHLDIYVIESYQDVCRKIDQALVSVPEEFIVAKYK